jgi:uncharacterized protein (DUF1697 family)
MIKKEFVKMADVCDIFHSIGLTDAFAVLTTGNIIFSSAKSSKILAEEISKALCTHYSYAFDTFLKTSKEVVSIVDKNPFENSPEYYTQIFIANGGFAKRMQEEFKKIHPLEEEETKITGDILYWHIPKENAMASSFAKILSRENLKHDFTLRTIGTMEKIVKRL